MSISLSEARIEQFDLEAAVSYASQFITDLSRQWFDLEPKLRPRFQKLVFPEGILYKKGVGVGTSKLGLIFKLKEESLTQKTPLVDPTGIEPVASSMPWKRSTK